MCSPHQQGGERGGCCWELQEVGEAARLAEQLLADCRELARRDRAWPRGRGVLAAAGRARLAAWREQAWRDRAAALYLTHQAVSEVLRRYDVAEQNHNHLTLEQLLRLANCYNETLQLATEDCRGVSTWCGNTCPILLHPLRKLSITKILQVLAQFRAELCCGSLVTCLLGSFWGAQEDTSASPVALCPSSPEHSDNSSLVVYRTLVRQMTPPDVATLPPVEKVATPRRELAASPGQLVAGVQQLVSQEQAHVATLLGVALRSAPHFLGQDGVRTSRTSGGPRVSRKARHKVTDYYQQVLWGEVGAFMEHVVLWWGEPALATWPPHCARGLRDWAYKLTASGRVPQTVVPAMQSLIDGLGCYVASTEWDQTFRRALVSGRLNTRLPSRSKQDGTRTGEMMTQLLEGLVGLSNSCEVTTEWLVLEELFQRVRLVLGCVGFRQDGTRTGEMMTQLLEGLVGLSNSCGDGTRTGEMMTQLLEGLVGLSNSCEDGTRTGEMMTQLLEGLVGLSNSCEDGTRTGEMMTQLLEGLVGLSNSCGDGTRTGEMMTQLLEGLVGLSNSCGDGTRTGEMMTQLLEGLVGLSNSCEVTTEWLSSPPLEELPLVEQIPVLHRLDHSVHSARTWTASQARHLANTWAMDAFFLVAHADVHGCLSQLARLQLAEHKDLAGVRSEHVAVCAQMRSKLVSEVRDNIDKLKKLPGECLEMLAVVCRTISLANLRMFFPEPRYWKQSGDTRQCVSPYVERYLDEVLRPVLLAVQPLPVAVQQEVGGMVLRIMPVLLAVQPLPVAVQQEVGGMVLRIMCEAWLDHIYSHKIKFTPWGAVQLLTDFAGVSAWLAEQVPLGAEVLSSLLRHEVLRRCEGVGRLLLRRPGEPIAMVAARRKHSDGGSEGAGSLQEDTMPAEMYVPNQEQWLELRASGQRGLCTYCLCCPSS
ncbi:uncharacterized protein LOC134536536 [Bacillus rossius redtenbacheri]|uniref:uncharacterized protein LOC134536536 n=1 Tax=Bacillus rossius redtenbacheri TaxID=93214 RepID=UPI002FDCC3DE